MKKTGALFACMFIGIGCVCQNPPSAVMEINRMVKSVDGIPVSGDTYTLLPGEHKAIYGDTTFKRVGANLYIPEYRERKLIFTVEEGNTYFINPSLSNVYDTNSRSVNFYCPVPQVINKKTLHAVSHIEYPRTFEPNKDSCGILHLNYSNGIMDCQQTALFRLLSVNSRSCLALSISGITRDNYQIDFTISSVDSLKKAEFRNKKIISAECNDLQVYLKPGYYKLSYSYRYTDVRPTYASNGYATKTLEFILEPNDTVSYDMLILPFSNKNVNLKAIRSSQLNSIFFLPDGQHGWIVGADGLIIRTKNGGKSWHISQTGKTYKGSEIDAPVQTNEYTDVYFADSLTGWLVGINDSQAGMILNTQDGGVKWTYQNVKSKIFDPLGTVRFLNKVYGYAVTTSILAYAGKILVMTNDGYLTPITLSHAGKLFVTTNGGINWTMIGKESDNAQFYPFNYNNIWKATRTEILHSTDMGQTWSFAMAAGKYSSKPDNLVYFIDPLHGWILQDGIQATKDGGKTWEKQAIDFPPEQLFFVNKDIGWAFALDGSISKTTDGGNTWSGIKPDPFIRNIADVFFLDENKGWLIGGGFIHNTEDGGQTWNAVHVLDIVYR